MACPHVCDPALLQRDLSGQTMVVTGANSGIGFVTAQQLAKQGAHVVMACRNTTEGEARAAEIRSAHSGASVAVQRLDLGDLASVRAFAEAFLVDHDKLDVLINNAGVMNTPDRKTADGFEVDGQLALIGGLALLVAALLLLVLIIGRGGRPPERAPPHLSQFHGWEAPGHVPGMPPSDLPSMNDAFAPDWARQRRL